MKRRVAIAALVGLLAACLPTASAGASSIHVTTPMQVAEAAVAQAVAHHHPVLNANIYNMAQGTNVADLYGLTQDPAFPNDAFFGQALIKNGAPVAATFSCIYFPPQLGAAPSAIPCPPAFAADAHRFIIDKANLRRAQTLALIVSREAVALASQVNKAVSGADLTAAASLNSGIRIEKNIGRAGKGGTASFQVRVSSSVTEKICIIEPTEVYGDPQLTSC